MKESQLENKTEIATNDYVRMVDENNNSVKIKKDSFMAAIRDALPSIISDGATGGGSVLSIINGALKTRTDANLASVLGERAHFTRTFDCQNAFMITTSLGFGWNQCLCSVEIMNGANGAIAEKYIVVPSGSTDLSSSVYRVYSGGTRSCKVYKSSNGRSVAFSAEDCALRVTISSNQAVTITSPVSSETMSSLTELTPKLSENTSYLSSLASLLGVDTKVSATESSYAPQDSYVFGYKKDNKFCQLCITQDKHILVRFSDTGFFEQII